MKRSEVKVDGGLLSHSMQTPTAKESSDHSGMKFSLAGATKISK